MDFLWEFYQQNRLADANSKVDRAISNAERIEARLNRLESTIDQVTLINVALAELMAEKLGLSESDILNRIREIDLRDGVQDGKLFSGVTRCRKCHRRYESKLGKCLYCGFVDTANQTILDRIPKGDIEPVLVEYEDAEAPIRRL